MAKITEYAHRLLSDHLKPGDTVIDATCGNGHDTIFLAQTVGEKGIVHAYDIQAIAIAKTKSLAKEYNLHNIIYHHESHIKIEYEEVDAVIFNLGYLPGGDKNIYTTSETTKEAIASLVQKMEKYQNMYIVIVLYPGFSEGKKESETLEDFLSSLKPHYLVTKINHLNQKNAPYIITIRLKRPS